MAEGYEQIHENTVALSGTTYFPTAGGDYDTQLYPYQNGNIILVDFALRPGEDIPYNTVIAKINFPKNLVRQVHLSTVTQENNLVRLVLNIGGNIQTESLWKKFEWISGTFVGFI